MSLRIVQPSGETTSGSMDMPRTSCHGAEIPADLPMFVLVTFEVPLCSLARGAALKVASIRECVSVDVTAVKRNVSIHVFCLANSQDWKSIDLLE